MGVHRGVIVVVLVLRKVAGQEFPRGNVIEEIGRENMGEDTVVLIREKDIIEQNLSIEDVSVLFQTFRGRWYYLAELFQILEGHITSHFLKEFFVKGETISSSQKNFARRIRNTLIDYFDIDFVVIGENSEKKIMDLEQEGYISCKKILNVVDKMFKQGLKDGRYKD